MAMDASMDGGHTGEVVAVDASMNGRHTGEAVEVDASMDGSHSGEAVFPPPAWMEVIQEKQWLWMPVRKGAIHRVGHSVLFRSFPFGTLRSLPF